MTDRLRLDQHTDDTLTELYDQRDQARRIAVALENELAATEAERDQHAGLLRRAEQYLAATHQHTARHDSLGENLTCAGCDLLARVLTALADPPQPPAEPSERRCNCDHPADEHSVYGCADWAEGSAPCTR